MPFPLLTPSVVVTSKSRALLYVLVLIAVGLVALAAASRGLPPAEARTRVVEVRSALDRADTYASEGQHQAAVAAYEAAVNALPQRVARAIATHSGLRHDVHDWRRQAARAQAAAAERRRPAAQAATPPPAAAPPAATGSAQQASGARCRIDTDCRTGFCNAAQTCELGVSPAVWRVGNRWVMQRTESSSVRELDNESYRYVREISNVQPTANGLRITLEQLGTDAHDDSDSLRFENGCLTLEGRRDRLLWCLPESPSAWTTERMFGMETRVARFTSEYGYQTAFSPRFGWIGFWKSSEGRQESHDTVGLRVGAVSQGEADLMPVTCDWDDRDYRVGSYDLARHAETNAERAIGALLGPSASNAQVLRVDTPGHTLPRRVFAAQVGAEVLLSWSPNEMVRAAGQLNDLGYWRNPATGQEHLVMLTRNGGQYGVHMAINGRMHQGQIRSNADRMSMAPLPVITGCLFRFAERDTPNERVADINTSSGTLARVGGSLPLR